MERKSTNTDLVAELEKRNSAGKYDRIIQRSKDNIYHDFKSPPELFAEPKSQLLLDLQQFPELHDIAADVINGIYDDPMDYQDAMKMRAEIIERDGEDSGMLTMLGLTLPDILKRFPESLNSDHHE